MNLGYSVAHFRADARVRARRVVRHLRHALTSTVHPLDVGLAFLLCGKRMFEDGWGDETLLDTLDATDVFSAAPQAVAMQWTRCATARSGVRVCNGVFASPLATLPSRTTTAHVRVLSRPGNRKACIVLAASREEGFALRQAIYAPLVDLGIDVVLLENPFYGLRRPEDQRRGPVRTVSDHILMNLAIVDEGRALVQWLHGQGYERIAVAGYSMGGFMAGLVGVTSDTPVAIASFASGLSPAPPLTRAFFKWSVDFAAIGGIRDGGPRITRVFDRANLTRFPMPKVPAACIIVGCRRDGYVPASLTEALHEHWRGSELRWVQSGHISALLTERAALRSAIVDGLARLPSAVQTN